MKLVKYGIKLCLSCLAGYLCLFAASANAQETCLNCHNNQNKLQALIKAKKVELGESTAEERSTQLLVVSEKMGSHGELDCQDCHQEDKKRAKSWHPSIQTDPTADGGTVCADCHGDEMVENFKHSLHFTVNGIAKGLTARLAQTPNNQKLFEEMHFAEHEGCSSCHATCGQCHISAPDYAGGGLLNKHEFIKVPPAEQTCESCHWENSEQHKEQDVHVTKHNMACTDCHTAEQEFHGRNVADIPKGGLYNKGPAHKLSGHYEQTQKSDIVVAECTDCHEDKEKDHTQLLTGKPALIDHNQKLECTACHTQPYTNCFGCHEDNPQSVGTWEILKQIANRMVDGKDEQNIKLGLSIANDKHSKLVPMSHSGGVSADSDVVVDLKDPNTKSYWVPFAAHFTAKNPLATPEARVSKRMCENCHNTKEDIFLTEEDVRLGETDPVSEKQWLVPKERLPKH